MTKKKKHKPIVHGWLTTKEVADQLGCCKDTVLARAGRMGLEPTWHKEGLRYYGGGKGVCLWTPEQAQQLKDATRVKA